MPDRKSVAFPDTVDGWAVIKGVTETLHRRECAFRDWDYAVIMKDAILEAILDLHRQRRGSEANP